MNKKHIGIITYHFARNYGAVWQCYALQEYLTKYGYNVSILNAMSQKQEKNNSLFNKKNGIKNIIVNICLLPFIKLRVQKENSFASFVTDTLNCTQRVFNNDELKRLVNDVKYDAIISGSDQVWNPHIADFEDMFFFPFDTSAKKIGYSVSIGESSYEEIKDYSKMVQDFDSVGVRELSAKQVVEKMYGRHVESTIDPVLLLPQKDWIKFVKKEPNQKKYLFCYFIDKKPLKKNMKIAEKIAKEKGLAIKCIWMHLNQNSFDSRFINNAGPIGFLNLIYNAETVITDGYHGTVFSTIFNKEIYSIINNRNSTDSRIRDYLSLIGLGKRLLYHDSQIIDFEPINYKVVQPLIEELPKQSYAFLETAINDN